MRFSFIISSLLFCLLLSACESDTISPQDTRLGIDYFPLKVGNYAEYRLEDIRYSLAGPPDTLNYLLREVVADSFPGEGGEIVYRLERFSRLTEADSWQLDSIWTARKSTRRLVVVENNVPYIKLVFPFSSGLTWDGNALNAKEPRFYELSPTDTTLFAEIDSPLDSLLRENSLTVLQEISQDTIITEVRQFETYVKDVGLFYKKNLRLEYCASSPECIGLEIIEGGRSYRQTLIRYGNENN
ncbi:MAG: hypothetical protein ACLFUB_12045 [Cyclobacteriaceae bacterium]